MNRKIWAHLRDIWEIESRGPGVGFGVNHEEEGIKVLVFQLKKMDGRVLPGKECALGHKSVYEKFNWNLWNVRYKIRYVFGCSKTSPGVDILKVKKK